MATSPKLKGASTGMRNMSRGTMPSAGSSPNKGAGGASFGGKGQAPAPGFACGGKVKKMACGGKTKSK